MRIARDRVEADRDAREGPGVVRWLGGHPVEVVFTLLMLGAFIALQRATAENYLFLDDWGLLLQAKSLGDLLDPYNDHLSVVILGLSRVLGDVFGISFRPFAVVSQFCLIAIPVSYFVTTRRTLGSALAAVLSLSLLSFGNVELWASVLNHYLVLVAGIVCAALLNRGRRADLPLAAVLLVALSSAGGGVAVAVACVVHNLADRASARRWITVLTPFAVWGIWWVTLGRTRPSVFHTRVTPTTSEAWESAATLIAPSSASRSASSPSPWCSSSASSPTGRGRCVRA